MDDEQYEHVKILLYIQQQAEWWRNSCVLYFPTFSKRPIPAMLAKPDRDLAYYKSLEFPLAPGISQGGNVESYPLQLEG